MAEEGNTTADARASRRFSRKPRLPSQVNLVKKYETLVTSGQAALRALMTLNGGATIAFLTFIGHFGEKSPDASHASWLASLPPGSGPAFICALQLFVYGTFCAVLGYGIIFLTNTLSFVETRFRLRFGRWEPSDGLFVVSICCGIASLTLFVMASQNAVAGFKLLVGKSVASG